MTTTLTYTLRAGRFVFVAALTGGIDSKERTNMTRRLPRNPSNLTFREWCRAAGWESIFDLRLDPCNLSSTVNQLTAAWHNNTDPAEYLSCAPKHWQDLAGRREGAPRI